MKAQSQPITVEQIAGELHLKIYIYLAKMFGAGAGIQSQNHKILKACALEIWKAKQGKLKQFPYGALTALRIHSAQIKEIRNQVAERKKELEVSTWQLKDFLSSWVVAPEISSKLEELVKIAENALAARDIGKGLDTAGLIKKLFELGLEMDREGLLQVITLNDKYPKDNIPDRIDLIRLKRLIILERIEDPEDAYLLEAMQ